MELLKMSSTQKNVAIAVGVVAIGAIIYYYYTKDGKKVIAPIGTGSTTPHPLEGKFVSLGGANGLYAGGAVFVVYKGKKYNVPSPIFDQFINNNGGNYDKLVILTQEKLDAIPNPNNAALYSTETIFGSAKEKGLYDGRDVYLGDIFTGLYTSGAVYKIKGDKKYAYTSPDWTAANKSKQGAVTADVLSLFTDGGTYTTTV